ncbi:hypothetical protein KUTeg_015087 [Tegillarca granosa]|uniref:Uncharacterized protein n=1 Tax=Tegillarca granosa TaxID=220873 RepID=A0ABQ9EUM5_TEGGR|nr:hypothetical protein KUTeg_015087 [Tegillarca granosa]
MSGMSVPYVPVTSRRGDPKNSPGGSVSPNVSSPHVVSQPQQQKILQDILDCINDMKSEYEKTTNPIDDDNQILHRFCAKLEYLLQCNMKVTDLTKQVYCVREEEGLLGLLL